MVTGMAQTWWRHYSKVLSCGHVHAELVPSCWCGSHIPDHPGSEDVGDGSSLQHWQSDRGHRAAVVVVVVVLSCLLIFTTRPPSFSRKDVHTPTLTCTCLSIHAVTCYICASADGSEAQGFSKLRLAVYMRLFIKHYRPIMQCSCSSSSLFCTGRKLRVWFLFHLICERGEASSCWFVVDPDLCPLCGCREDRRTPSGMK